VYELSLERLQLSPRTLNCLRRARVNTVGEVLAVPDEELLAIRNFGEKSLAELRERLAEHGFPKNGRET
jgi:DNA-directed RNA polymerase subunit alpha